MTKRPRFSKENSKNSEKHNYGSNEIDILPEQSYKTKGTIVFTNIVVFLSLKNTIV